MKSELIMAVNQICAEKDLPREVILGAIEEALMHAYRRNYSNNTANVQVKIDDTTGDLRVLCEKTVVDVVEDGSVEISLADARKIDRNAEIGGTVLDQHEPNDFGRIAAQTAKQVILQRIHEAERDALYEYYKQREGELITGQVQSIDYRQNQVTISLSKKAEGILAAEDQLPNDRYRTGQSIRTLLAEVSKGTRGPQIRLSRTHRNMLRRLLEREIPEIYSGTVEIKSIAREPGQRSKVAVFASQPGVDPVGSCVGLRGTRIQNIVDELNNEKIDVVEWSNDVRAFISNALSPARPSDTILIEEGEVRTAIVVVPDRQLSLAIGKEGQNARLAAKLTGWRIDIKSETEAATEGLAEIKRQQVQMVKARQLQDKAAALPSTEDLLSRAEWLLKEKDKTSVTLEQAAQLLARADQAKEDSTVFLDAATAAEAQQQTSDSHAFDTASAREAAAEALTAEPSPVAPKDEAEPVAVEDASPPTETIETIELPVDAFEEEFIAEYGDVEPIEGEEDPASKKPAKKGKKTGQKSDRELVFDENLGQVVSRKKRKPGRTGGWGDFEDF